jgi:hypothetical protein
MEILGIPCRGFFWWNTIVRHPWTHDISIVTLLGVMFTEWCSASVIPITCTLHHEFGACDNYSRVDNGWRRVFQRFSRCFASKQTQGKSLNVSTRPSPALSCAHPQSARQRVYALPCATSLWSRQRVDLCRAFSTIHTTKQLWRETSHVWRNDMKLMSALEAWLSPWP